MREAYERRVAAEQQEAKFLNMFAAAVTAGFENQGFHTVLECAKPTRDLVPAEWGTNFIGRASFPRDPMQPKGFHVILDYRFTAAFSGDLDTPTLTIHNVGMTEAKGGNIIPPRGWRYDKPLMGDAQEQGQDVVNWLLENYRKVLLNRENR